MTSFDKAFAYTMEWEGGSKFTNDPDDPGGATKYGVSKRSHPDIDIENLTEEAAKTLYALNYWNGINGNQLAEKSERVAIKVFDMGVNIGTVRAVKFLQESLNSLEGVFPKLEEDGRLGPGTLRGVAQVDEDDLLEVLSMRLEKYYMDLNKPKYLKGWLRRARCLPV
jgi:lysozyme family protein